MVGQNIIIKEHMLGGGLGLQGIELVLYAFIDSFSTHEGGMYCSERYLSKMLGCSRECISRALRRLVGKNLIVRSEERHSPGNTYSYKVNTNAVADVTKDHIAWPTKVTHGGLQSSHRIINRTSKYDSIIKRDNERSSADRSSGESDPPGHEGFRGTSRL